jgi:hypothetical protein
VALYALPTVALGTDEVETASGVAVRGKLLPPAATLVGDTLLNTGAFLWRQAAIGTATNTRTR